MTEKGMKQKPEEPDKRVIVTVRNVSQHRWKTVQAMADRMNLKLRGVLDEMMDDWIKKHSK